MREYTHKNHPELRARIEHVWHKAYRNDNYTLLYGNPEKSQNELILTRVLDDEIENNPFWILTYDTEPGGKNDWRDK